MHDADILADVSRLLGEPARARILTELLDGGAFTGKELAYFAGVTAATASAHLARLVAAELLVMEKQGRFNYYRLKSGGVARAIEGLMAVAPVTIPAGWPPSHRVDATLRNARLCYDHMAGRLGVFLCDMLVRRGYLVLVDGGGEVTDAGTRFLARLGVDLDRAGRARRRYCRSCIDWTERRRHLSGAVGAALAEAFLEQGWVSRNRDSRVLTVTPGGRKKLTELGVVDPSATPLEAPGVSPRPALRSATRAPPPRAPSASR